MQFTTFASALALVSAAFAASVVSQISDGQIQATTATEATSSVAVVSQITDGQIQATTSTETASSVAVVSQITDGQIQATSTAATIATQTGGVANLGAGAAAAAGIAMLLI